MIQQRYADNFDVVPRLVILLVDLGTLNQSDSVHATNNAAEHAVLVV